MTPVQITFGSLLAVALLVTVIGYPRKYGALSGRSRLYRTLGVALIDLLLVVILVFVSTDFSSIVDPRVRAVRVIIYTLTFLFLTLSLMGLAGLDVLESIVVYRRERRAALEQMVREEAARQVQKQQQAQQVQAAQAGDADAHESRGGSDEA
jgi:membrane protease YdiL (CAAX protease family)